MAETLVPITQFDPNELGPRLKELVGDNWQQLQARHIIGDINRYYSASVVQLASYVKKAQTMHLTGELSFYPVVGEDDLVHGVGKIYPGLRLFKQRLPLPPAISKKLNLSRDSEIYDPNISAWTDYENPHLLAVAYTGLVSVANARKQTRNDGFIWTIEPNRSPDFVHEAILDAGLLAINSTWYDDQESNKLVPPRSILYTQPFSPLDY